MIIGTAGHIDHGKSALVKALTGIDPDRLKEEQLRGITLDLGFAHCALPNGETAGIVDVPGHERLVHNMLAGAGGMDMAMVVVAADEGVKPQTVEHVEILDLLGVGAGVGVITKIDLVGEDERGVAHLELEELLERTSLAASPIVEVSSVTGEGIETLRETLGRVASSIHRRPLDRPFRLPLDRVFTLQGFGTVVTGTALAGRVVVGQSLDVVPVQEEVRVRGIHVHGNARDEASAGERVALNVTARRMNCQRGHVLAEQGVFVGTDCLDCRVRMLKSAPARRRVLTARLYVGTTEVLARVLPLEEGLLRGPGEGYVQIRTRLPVAAARGDRFVLRSEDDQVTIGGGRIIDAYAPRRGPRKGRAARALAAVDGVSDEEAFDAHVAARPEGVTFAEVARFLNVGIRRATDIAKGRLQDGAAILAADGSRIIARDAHERLVAALHEELVRFHEANPLKPAMALSDLRSRFEPRLQQAVETALHTLSSTSAVIVEAGAVRRAGHAVAFDERKERTRQAVLALYERASLQPPGTDGAIASLAEQGLDDAAAVIASLVETGDLVSLSHELLLHRRVLDDAQARLIPFLKTPDGVTVAQVREILGTTRKYAVPLLELFDRRGLTVRRGDVRILSPSWGVSRHDMS